MSNIKPDCLYPGYFANHPDIAETGMFESPAKKAKRKASEGDCETTRRNQAQLRFSVLRVVWRIRRKGLTLGQAFQAMRSGDGYGLTAAQILEGVKTQLGVHMSFEESSKFTSYLDLDKSGDVSQYEFTNKLDYFMENLDKEVQPFQLSLTHFLDKLVQDWGFFRDQQKSKIMKVLAKNDFAPAGNAELSFNIDKFAKLIRSFETYPTDHKPPKSGGNF